MQVIISHENHERANEYASDMNITLEQAINEALAHWFDTVGLAKREHKAEQAIENIISRMGEA